MNYNLYFDHLHFLWVGLPTSLDLETIDLKTITMPIVFMEQELFDKGKKCDEKNDVFSFGIVMYFVVTRGEFPKYSFPE